MPCSSICPVFITFWHCVSLQSSLLFHHAHPGLVIKWAQLKFTLQVVPAAPGVSANASFHFTARVISTQHHQDTVHDGFRILVGRRQSGPCSICYVVEMRMCGTPCLLYLARILTLSLESSTASLPHLEYNVCTMYIQWSFRNHYLQFAIACEAPALGLKRQHLPQVPRHTGSQFIAAKSLLDQHITSTWCSLACEQQTVLRDCFDL